MSADPIPIEQHIETQYSRLVGRASSTGGHGRGGRRSRHQGDGGAGLPRIDANNRQLREVTHDALSAQQSANNPPVLFARSGRLVSIQRNEHDQQVIRETGKPELRGHLTRSANYFKVSPNGTRTACAPPLEVVEDFLSLPPSEWGFPCLEGIVETPVLREDGTILDKPGYDDQTSLFYAPDANLRIPEIAESPTRDHIDVALDLILGQVFGDFPWKDEASRAHALALTLTPFIKPAIDAPVPAAIVSAPQAGSGKTLVGEVVSEIATGGPAELFSYPREEEEMRKQLTTAITPGKAVVVIDNVSGKIDSPEFAKVLTARHHADRMFRTHEKIVLPIKCTWIVTGNNVQLGGDLPRRCYWIRLDAKTSRPFLRTGFQIPDLRAWVSEHRGELIAALLTLCRGWFVAGRPLPKNFSPLGSYERWSTMIAGILSYAGVEGFLGNAGELYSESDTEATQWEGFLQELHEQFYGDPFTIADVWERLRGKTWNEATRTLDVSEHASALRLVLPDWLAEVVERPGFFQRRAGRAFAERVDRRFGDSQVHLQRAGVLHKVQQWKIGGLGG